MRKNASSNERIKQANLMDYVDKAKKLVNMYRYNFNVKFVLNKN
jgi:hypothetical protein